MAGKSKLQESMFNISLLDVSYLGCSLGQYPALSPEMRLQAHSDVSLYLSDIHCCLCLYYSPFVTESTLLQAFLQGAVLLVVYRGAKPEKLHSGSILMCIIKL